MSDFKAAADRVKTLTKSPGNDQLLKLYALYKQGSEGDVTGKRPSAFNLKGRAKFDAWAGLKGTSQDDAQASYIKLVDELAAKFG